MKSNQVGAGQPILASQIDSIRADASGAGALLVHQQLGALALGTLPSNGQVIPIVINGTTITLTAVSSIGSTANNILIPGTPAAFALNVWNFLIRPDISNANQVAATSANQALIQLLGYALPTGGTTITIYSLNNSQNQLFSTLTFGSITVTSGSWTAQTMKLYVEPGIFYINGTKVNFLGGSSPLVTAPVSHPRIDILTINSSGTLAWTTGTENVSPTVPAYPSYTLIVLCELYNVVGETILEDYVNQQAGQGYIQLDSRSFPSVITNFDAISQDFIPDTTNTRSLGSVSVQFLNIYAQNIFSGSQAVAFTKFGGTGADGALTITSGTTTLNASSASILIKNYAGISITGTASLTISNPGANGTILILKSNAGGTFTSSNASVEMSNMGAPGGTSIAVALNGKGPRTATATGTTFFQPGPSTETSYFNVGQQGAYLAGGAFARTGVFCGSGGVAGANLGNVGATGAGGGGLLMEILGALNFTGTINANGQNGGNGGSSTWGSGFTQYCNPNGGSGQTDGGPGGNSSSNFGSGVTTSTQGPAGGGGCVVILYGTLTANSGTINVNAGTNGTGSFVAGAPASGFSYVGINDVWA